MTNRMRLLRCANDLGKIMEDPAVSPTPYSALQEAREAIMVASRFPLEADEREHEPVAGFST